MTTPPSVLLLLLTLSGWQCSRGADTYLSEFLKAASGRQVPFQLSSSSLVDTNNCSPSARYKAISLTPGVLLGLRPGMSMDEVASLWGKPVSIGCCRTNRPCFNYGDIYVYFQENRVSEIGWNIWMPFTPQFVGGLVPLSPTTEWIQRLGTPTSQPTNAFWRLLCYETNQSIMTLCFDLENKQLSKVTLARPTANPGADK